MAIWHARKGIGMDMPKHRVRIAITKNTKGYQHETTIEVEWDGDPATSRELWRRLLSQSDEDARTEIMHREHADAAA